MPTWEEKKVLITVKTYPVLSKKYDRLVCTAGITEDGEWIRLYPVPWWDLDEEKKFKKFDWIKVKVKPADEKLNRRESHKVKEDSIEIVDGLPVSRDHSNILYEKTGKRKFKKFSNRKREENWKERLRIVDEASFSSVEELRDKRDDKNYSLGAIQPKKVKNFYWEDGDDARNWEKDLVDGTQQTLAQDDYETPLEHISKVFKYNFECKDERCNEHNKMAEDWEMLQAWRKWREEYDDSETTFEKLKQRFYTDMFEEKDSYLILGTESQYNNFLVIGLFYPPKEIMKEVQDQTGVKQFL